MANRLLGFAGILVFLLIFQSVGFASDDWALFEIDGRNFSVKVGDQDARQEVLCSICLSIFTDPVRDCPDEHSFCRGCYEKNKEETKNCPICRQKFIGTPLLCLELNRKITNLTTRCSECDWKGAYSDVSIHIQKGCHWSCQNEGCDESFQEKNKCEQHKETCLHRKVLIEVIAGDLQALGQLDGSYIPTALQQKIARLMQSTQREYSPFQPNQASTIVPDPQYQLQSCPHGCSFKGHTVQMTAHQNCCPKQRLSCDDCGESVLKRKMKEHLRYYCDVRLVSCDSCGQKVQHNELFNEHREECPSILISCPNQSRGCEEIMLNGLKAEHLESCQFEEVECPDGCGEHYQRRMKSNHQNTCPIPPCENCHSKIHSYRCGKRVVRCHSSSTGCLATFLQEEREQHNAECQYLMVECHCGQKIQRRYLAGHQNQCIAPPQTMTIRNTILQQYKGNIYHNEDNEGQFYWYIRKDVLNSLMEKEIECLVTSAFPLGGEDNMCVQLTKELELTFFITKPGKDVVACPPVSYLSLTILNDDGDHHPESFCKWRSTRTKVVNKYDEFNFSSEGAKILLGRDKVIEMKECFHKCIKNTVAEYVFFAIEPSE